MSDTPCPSCGHCPTCGHRAAPQWVYPHWQIPAAYPSWPYPTTITCGTGTIGNQSISPTNIC